MQKNSIIYHYTLPISNELTSGSYLHAANLLRGFREIGYEVELVAGFAEERKQAVRRIEDAARKGRKFDFVFAWSSTSPSLLPRGNFFHPLLDYNFFLWCKRQNIPTGLFYGDVYWRFDFYRQILPWYKWSLLIPLFHYDWFTYKQTISRLFLPTMRMKDYLPSQWPQDKIHSLFPGCDNQKQIPPFHPQPKQPKDCLELFYVGSISPPLYDLKPMIDGVLSTQGIRLTICCPEKDWAKHQPYYLPQPDVRIRIVHAHGDELTSYYRQADLFSLFRSPHPYLSFAMPVKVFETVGYAIPILTTAGTEVSDFVTRENIGWPIENINEYVNLLQYLKNNPQEIQAKRDRIIEIQKNHTWAVRAKSIVHALTSANFPGADTILS